MTTFSKTKIQTTCCISTQDPLVVFQSTFTPFRHFAYAIPTWNTKNAELEVVSTEIKKYNARNTRWTLKKRDTKNEEIYLYLKVNKEIYLSSGSSNVNVCSMFTCGIKRSPHGQVWGPWGGDPPKFMQPIAWSRVSADQVKGQPGPTLSPAPGRRPCLWLVQVAQIGGGVWKL